MTLTSRAEHAHSDRVSAAYDEATADVSPHAIAERHVLDAEGPEADPTRVNAHTVARDAAEDAREEVSDAAAPYAGGPAVCEDVGERAFERAYDYAVELMRDSPRIEVVTPP